MQEQHGIQSSLLAMIYDELIPCDHLLRPLSPTVDLSPVPDLVSDCYCPDNGRPSWDPLVLFKAVFLQFLYDLSDGHLACKWFGGPAAGTDCPDHTALCHFRTRLETNGQPSSTIVKKNRGGLEGLWPDPPGEDRGRTQAEGEQVAGNGVRSAALGSGNGAQGMMQTPTTE
jgi:transposase